VAHVQKSAQSIGYLSQEPSIFRGLTVEEKFMGHRGTAAFAQSEQKAKVEGLLEELGLAQLAKQLSVTLSGGEKRRCE